MSDAVADRLDRIAGAIRRRLALARVERGARRAILATSAAWLARPPVALLAIVAALSFVSTYRRRLPSRGECLQRLDRDGGLDELLATAHATPVTDAISAAVAAKAAARLAALDWERAFADSSRGRRWTNALLVAAMLIIAGTLLPVRRVASPGEARPERAQPAEGEVAAGDTRRASPPEPEAARRFGDEADRADGYGDPARIASGDQSTVGRAAGRSARPIELAPRAGSGDRGTVALSDRAGGASSANDASASPRSAGASKLDTRSTEGGESLASDRGDPLDAASLDAVPIESRDVVRAFFAPAR